MENGYMTSPEIEAAMTAFAAQARQATAAQRAAVTANLDKYAADIEVRRSRGAVASSLGSKLPGSTVLVDEHGLREMARRIRAIG